MDCLIYKKVVLGVLGAIFLMACLVNPTIAQVSTDAVLILHFDESSGTTVKDESGHGNDGTIHGATWVDGISGKALSFDGVDDYVECGSHSSLNMADEITIEAWVKPASSGERDWGRIVDKLDGSTRKGYSFHMLGGTSQLNVKFYANSEGIWLIGTDDSTNKNEWTHVAVTYDKDAGFNNLKIYINGILDNQGTDVDAITTSSVNFQIGNSRSFARAFDGIIDEVAIYSKALTPEEINAHYLAKRAGGSIQNSAHPEIEDGEGVTTNGGLQSSTGTVVADDVKKSSGMPIFIVIFAIVGLLVLAYFIFKKSDGSVKKEGEPTKGEPSCAECGRTKSEIQRDILAAKQKGMFVYGESEAGLLYCDNCEKYFCGLCREDLTMYSGCSECGKVLDERLEVKSLKGIGVVFDIDDLGGGFYGSAAWRIFLRNLRPENIIGCVLREGDTSETMSGNRREFCIAVLGAELNTDLFVKVFKDCSEKGFASSNRRFILSPKLDSEPLMEAGIVDSMGRLMQDEWSRIFHDRCKDCGWGFAPKSVPGDLSPELKSELKELQSRTVTKIRASGSQSKSQPTQNSTKRKWWQFWK